MGVGGEKVIISGLDGFVSRWVILTVRMKMVRVIMVRVMASPIE